MFKTVLFLLFPILNFAQIIISGNVSNDMGEFVSGANVTITAKEDVKVLAYDISDEKGNYRIELNLQNDSVQLNVRAVNYHFEQKIIENRSQVIDFQLWAEVTKLKDVIAKANPITQEGDTLNYSVAAFASKNDRSIADVLSKMPGIEVEENGRILFEGNPINKYYIENMDLLGGKYNLANENLPYKEVVKVQVLKNHQPIKILDSISHSEQAAINIKLKNAYTLTGQAEVGLGAAPILWKINTTPMLFARKQQTIVSYQSNNTGEDIKQQLEMLTINDLLNPFETNENRSDWCNIKSLQTPVFDSERWLNNQTHLISLNHLRKMKSDFEFKANIDYSNDYQTQKGSSATQIFVDSDTITYSENSSHQTYIHQLKTQFNLLKNTKKNYLKNKLKIHSFWDGERNHLYQNDQKITQNLENKYFHLSNRLNSIIPFGRKLVQLNSYFGYSRDPQYLLISPGIFSELLNQGQDYETTNQNIIHTSLLSNQQLSLNSKWKKISISSKIGWIWKKQNMESYIGVNHYALDDDLFMNKMQSHTNKLYSEIKTQYKQKGWLIYLNLPLTQYHFKLENINQNQQKSQLNFEPSFFVNKKLNAYLKLNLSAEISRDFSGVEQWHTGYLVSNYRNIKKNNGVISQSENRNISTGFTYKNPVNSLFFHVKYALNETENEWLYSTQILENGTEEMIAEYHPHNNQSSSISGRFSKYFSKLNTHFSFRTQHSFSRNWQKTNQILSHSKSYQSDYKTKLSTELSKKWNIALSLNFLIYKNQFSETEKSTIQQTQWLSECYFFATENHTLGFNTEYLKNTNSSVSFPFFADLSYQFNWKKYNIDFRLKWKNVFNQKSYLTVVPFSYGIIKTNYELRPSQIMLSANFSF